MPAHNRNRIIIQISIFTALTAVGAFIKIPLPPVPVTLQTFFVIMSGNLLGFKYGAVSQIIYLALGLIGIPIFAYGGGPGYIFQPSFGYLLGYPVGAFTIGLLLSLLLPEGRIEKTSMPKLFLIIAACDFAGVLIIFIFGLVYFFANFKYGLYLNLENLASVGLSWDGAVKTALCLFVPIDLIKVLLAAWLTVSLKRLSLFEDFFSSKPE